MSLWLGILGGQITATVPGIISYANASQGTGTSLTWDPPSSNGGYPILGYRIYFQADGTSTWTNISNSSPNFITSDVTNVTLEGTDAIIDGNLVASTILQNNIFYYFRISAYNAIGEASPVQFTGDVPSTVGQT